MDFDPVAYINTPRWQTSRLGLGRIARLLDLMGRPQDRLRFVHVAGTNGKGSTCAYLESILRCAGCKTGLFTSPYVEVFEERIRVDGENISRADLMDVTLSVKRCAERVEAETGDHPTEFELMTAAAFEHFARSACDIVVLEVGLGGRLDSTNVIDAPEACVITRVGLDHTALLGTAVAQVATEKAGIVKAGAPVVSWPQEPEAMSVVQAAATEGACQLVLPDFTALEVEPLGRRLPHDVSFAGDSRDERSLLCSGEHSVGDRLAERSVGEGFADDALAGERPAGKHPAGERPADGRLVERRPAGNALAGERPAGEPPFGDRVFRGREFAYSEPRQQNVSRETFVRKFSYKGVEYETRLLGSYQPANAALAIETARALRERGWKVTDEAVREGVARAEWPGRFEVVALDPLTIVDGGHNPQGARVLAESLAEFAPFFPRVFGFDAKQDSKPLASHDPCAPCLFGPRDSRSCNPSDPRDAGDLRAFDDACDGGDPCGIGDARDAGDASDACGASVSRGASVAHGAGEPCGVVFVMGVLADKDYAAMIAEVLPLARAFFTYTPENPRALSSDDLAVEVKKQAKFLRAVGSSALRSGACESESLRVETCVSEVSRVERCETRVSGASQVEWRESWAEDTGAQRPEGETPGAFRVEACGSAAEALRFARDYAGEGGLVVAFGSLYAVADLKTALREEA